MNNVSESIIEEDDITDVTRLRRAYNALADMLATIPPGRHRSIAITELETSSMYAIKALTIGNN